MEKRTNEALFNIHEEYSKVTESLMNVNIELTYLKKHKTSHDEEITKKWNSLLNAVSDFKREFSEYKEEIILNDK